MMLLLLSILTSFITNLENNTLISDCVLSVSSDKSQSFSYPGSVVMQGDKFSLSMLGIEAAYDGKTLYMYSEDTDELTLTSPTEEELQQTNPLCFARALAKVSRIEEKTTSSGNIMISLYPNDISAGIMHVTLTLDKEGKLPLSIEIKEADKSSRLTFVEPVIKTDNKNDSNANRFIIEKEGAFLNDLR